MRSCPLLKGIIFLVPLVVGCASTPRNPVLDKYPAGVLGRTTVTYYDVHGRTLAELSADMRRLGPKVNGTSYVGETRSPMRWSWRLESAMGSTCTIRNLVVSVNAQILLPRWTPPADTEPGVAAEWNRFMAALEAHEAGHKDITARAGAAIADQLRGLSTACSMINDRANDVARVIADRASEEQKRYDAETRHGLTQGTGFGPRPFVATLDPSAPLVLLARSRVGTVRATLPVPLERLWAAMAGAYAASGLEINAVDSASHAVGDSMHVRARIGALAISDVIDCGSTPAGWNADSVDVAIFVTSRLDAGQTPGTTVTNTVQAVAHPQPGDPVACRSRAVLERRILDALRSELAR